MDKLSLQNPLFATYVIAATLAEAAHLTPRQFSRAFRAETGQSPAKAVENLRVEAARLMMERSRHPIDVIARQTGFADRDRMRRAFRQPPQVIRRNARAEAMAWPRIVMRCPGHALPRSGRRGDGCAGPAVARRWPREPRSAGIGRAANGVMDREREVSRDFEDVLDSDIMETGEDVLYDRLVHVSILLMAIPMDRWEPHSIGGSGLVRCD